MMRLLFRIVLLILCILLFFGGELYSCADIFSIEETDLEKLLDGAEKYCERVKRIALSYICNEEVGQKLYKYRVNLSRFTQEMPERMTYVFSDVREKTYIHDYQLIKKEESLEERRILTQEDGKRTKKENALLRTKYQGKYLVYGAVGFLSRDWQNHFDYEIVGPDRVGDLDAVVIKATPKSSNQKNRNTAKIWLVNKDFSILKIQWEPESIQNYKDRELATTEGDLKKTVVWEVLYGLEQNGVRFPTHQSIKEYLVNPKGKKFIWTDIQFTYYDYKFFIVETEIKY